jgi:hypothetical protein
MELRKQIGSNMYELKEWWNAWNDACALFI